MSNEEVNLLEGEDKAVKTVGENVVKIIEDDAPVDDGMKDARQDAYEGGFTWRDKKLEPFSSSRDSLFVRVRRLMGAPDLIKVYQNLELFVGDAHLILFLCSHSLRELIPLMRDLDGMLEEVMAWADINVTKADASEAALLAMRILNDSRINGAEAVPTEGIDSGHELGN